MGLCAPPLPPSLLRGPTPPDTLPADGQYSGAPAGAPQAASISGGVALHGQFLAQNGFPAEKITVLPPHFISDDDRPAYLPSTEPDCILYAGRLEVEKGFPYLLEALAALPGTGRLLVAGDGTQRAIYEAMAQELGVGARVSFLGWLDEQTLNQVLRQCSLVAMPSIFPEPFGKVGIEALMQGRPVVASDVGGISDWLEDGVNGLLVRPADSPALAAKINQLLHDEVLRTRMGKSGQDAVLRHYKASQHRSVLIEVFAAAIEDSMANVISSVR